MGIAAVRPGPTTGYLVDQIVDHANKRNPDAAELVRGHSARIVGDLVALLVLLRGLPLAYAKDLQDDKPPLFDAHDLLSLSLAAMAGMIADLTFVPERMRAAAAAGHATATDLADWLVREAGVPFREAHHIAGRVVAAAEERGVALDALSLDELRAVEGKIGRVDVQFLPGQPPVGLLSGPSPRMQRWSARPRGRDGPPKVGSYRRLPGRNWTSHLPDLALAELEVAEAL